MLKHFGMVVAAALILAAGLATAGLRPALGQSEEKITICHAAGLAGTTHYVTLTISRNAVFGPAGHFFENGTPQAGHEQDYMGACVTETTTTDTTTTTTTTTDPEERGLPQIESVCDLAAGVYRLTATWDDLPATVTPNTIPGDKDGSTLVIVAQGGDTQGFIVNTAGTCVQTTTTTQPPGDDPPGTTTTSSTPTETTTTTESTTTGETTTTPVPTAPGETTPVPPGQEPPTTTSPRNPASPGQPTTGSPGQPTTGKPGKPNAPGTPVPLCPVGKPANSPNEPCAVQGNG